MQTRDIYNRPPELKIRGGIEDDSKIIFLISQNICCDPSLELSCQDSSNDGSQNMFLWRNGKRGPGRPKMTWKQLTERDRREWKLSAIDPHDRDTWRSGVRSAMHAASHLLGRGPTVVNMAPIPAR